ncbi:MAG: hypothetical protein JJT75_06335 [Opitutales bacterium]|nr:hypothetical protein [Opitutales bacterium]
MKNIKDLLKLLLASVAILGLLTACENGDQDSGDLLDDAGEAAEEAGESIEDAAEDVADEVEDAADEVEY